MSRKWFAGFAHRARRERPFATLPKPVVLAVLVALLAQLLTHASVPPPQAIASELAPAPRVQVMRVAALGEPVAAARLISLWLQAHDNQPGVSLPYASLDYARVSSWLHLALELDPDGEYPLMAATRLYANVAGVPERRRLMLEFVHDRFIEDPKRWRWLAEAALMAKYKLKDLPLALRYARALNTNANGVDMPAWARDLELLVLADMCELEAARVLIGGLMHSGRIEDPNELRFVERRLEEMDASGCRN